MAEVAGFAPSLEASVAGLAAPNNPPAVVAGAVVAVADGADVAALVDAS